MVCSNKKILIAFILPIIFWVYLAFSSQMTIVFDSVGYEWGGRTLNSEGLSGYFKNGPQREPLYPYLISLSMRLADVFDSDYKKIQTCFQILLLLLGQIILYRMLLHLKLNNAVVTGALLYYGFSPSLISCGLDLYSEIITLPFIILSVLSISKAWQSLLCEDIKATFYYALGFTLSSTAAVFSKAILAALYPLFVLPFVFILVSAVTKGKKKRVQCAVIFLTLFFVIFSGSVAGYKFVNKKYHGNYTFAGSRGVIMLYTIALKRTAPLTKELLGVAVSSVPGEKVCRSFYGQKACHDWLLDTVRFGSQKKNELTRMNVSEEQIDQILLSLSIKQILSNPFQYSLFASLEGLKVFFWESTKIGFVSYPGWLTKIHDNVIFKNMLRLLVGLSTFMSTVYLVLHLLKIRRKKYVHSDANYEKYQCWMFLTYFLMLFIGLYSSVTMLVRYALPIVPLFITVIAFVVNEQLQKYYPSKNLVK